MKKVFFTLLLAVLIAQSFSLGRWRVCLGSFRVKSNAELFVETLRQKGLKATCQEDSLGGASIYRVITQVGFDDINETRTFCSELSQTLEIKALALTGLWVCAAHKGVALQSNDALPINQDSPYSVRIATFKDFPSADSTAKRLRSDKVDAYIVKTYDEDEYFDFDVNAGAFSQKSDAESFQAKLEKEGLKTLDVADYKTLESKINAFDEVVKSEEVTFDEGVAALPKTIPPLVAKTIHAFPINRDYTLERLYIVDLDNARAGAEELETFEANFASAFNSHAFSFAQYTDPLRKRRIDIGIFDTGEEPLEKNALFKAALSAGSQKAAADFTRIDFLLKGVTVPCTFTYNDGEVFLLGSSNSLGLAIFMRAEGFDAMSFQEFLSDTNNDSDLLIYPQVRRTLCVLPKKREGVSRRFISFSLEKLGDDYAVSKGGAQWARAMVGHWGAKGLFLQGDTKFVIGFYDMDYNRNAKRIHKAFMAKHEEFDFLLGPDNHKTTFNNLDGWYVKTYDSNEVSFSYESQITSVVSIDSKFSEKELIKLAQDLKIWEE